MTFEFLLEKGRTEVFTCYACPKMGDLHLLNIKIVLGNDCSNRGYFSSVFGNHDYTNTTICNETVDEMSLERKGDFLRLKGLKVPNNTMDHPDMWAEALSLIRDSLTTKELLLLL